ncbi:unnamed protein product [Rotaria sp. Silwood2]|nr:unnamed protein product [Rotaria sp. Silwood2]CAF2786774.1 unnamed protein product [Rotaria sp. Silwood2]CAF4138315.1 unnamed protein product [Rotaria sp. Silwood2]
MNRSNNSSQIILRLNEITANIYRSSFPPLIIFGLIGHVFDIIIFTRPKLISNSCCNYCLASSCVSIIQILFGQFFRLLKGGFYMPIPVLWWCRVRVFFLYSAYLASTTLITLASADRFASSCSQVKYRRWANVKVARRLIPIVLIISGLSQSHMLALFVVHRDGEKECWAPRHSHYRLGYDISFLIVHGIIFPVLLGTFGFLTIYNISRRCRFDQQNGPSSLRRHRIRDFQRMTLVQTACAIALTLPFAVHKLYLTVNTFELKTPETLAWELLSMSIVRLLWFFHDSGAFYIYSLSSVKFRHELFKFLDEYLPRRAPRHSHYRLGYDISFLIAHGLIFRVLMSIFGFLMIYNIRQRCDNDPENRLSHLKCHSIQDFQCMTLVQTACAIALTLPFAINKLYRTVIIFELKTSEKLAWERLSMSIVRLL